MEEQQEQQEQETDKITQALENIKVLEELITDRIVELHKVQGWQLDRQVLILYRSILWEIRDTLKGD